VLIGLNQDGSQDGSFADGGVFVAPADPTAMALDGQGRILFDSGYIANNFENDFGLSRLVVVDRPDGPFLDVGSTTVTVDNVAPTPTIAARTGSISTFLDNNVGRSVAFASPAGDLVVLDGGGVQHFDAHGSLLGSFQPDALAPAALAVDSSGRVLLAGGATSGNAVARYQLDGTLDTSFGSGGLAAISSDATVTAMTVDARGDIVLVGSVNDAASGNSWLWLTRLTADGASDPTFGQAGTVVVQNLFPTGSFGTGIGVDPVTGKLIALAGTNDGYRFVRFNADGSVDTTFGNGSGWVALSNLLGGSTLAVDSLGRMLVAAPGGGWGNGDVVQYARYLSDGSLDTGFGDNGIASGRVPAPSEWQISPDEFDAGINGIAVDAQDRVALTGFGRDDSGDGFDGDMGLALARFTSDGTPDPTFGFFGAPPTIAGAGTVVTLAGLVSDPGGANDAPYSYSWTVSADNGATVPGVSGTVSTYTGAVPDFSFTPAHDGTYAVTFTVTDKYGASGTTTDTIVVDTPPVAHIAANQSATSAADTANLLLSATDTTAQELAAGFTYAIDWGDRTTAQTVNATANNGSGIPVNHTFATDGSYLVSVTATDKDGAVGPAATSLVVVSSMTGDRIGVSGAGAGQVAVSVTPAAAPSIAPATTFSPTDLVLVSGQGGSDTYTVYFGSTLTTPITLVGRGVTSGDTLIANGDPSLMFNYINKSVNQATGSGQVTWGSPVTETVAFSGVQHSTLNPKSPGQNSVYDPGGDTVINGGPGANTIIITATSGAGVVINGGPGANSYIIDMGSLAAPVTINSTSTGSTSTLTVAAPPGSNALTLSATQLTGAGETINLNLGTTATNITVDGSKGNNQLVVQGTPPGPVTAQHIAPTAGAITAPIAPVSVTSAVTATAPLTELDGSAVTATWAWGDGTTTGGSVSQSGTTGTASGSHTYAAAGVYTLTLTLTNASHQTGQAFFQYAVVYDPSAGFVTGGGWINSPTGAYAANPGLTGKATFGFVAKYQKGATVPTGNTAFQFQVANFNFQSTSYDWLVVSGAKAQYKGSGTVNGSGNYGFLLTAIDGALPGGGGQDKFRLKIWDKTTGAVVYDNQMGGADTADPTTVLGGGSILIHSGK
jgi:uncharacterized delta-60 repeat protein